jgi:phosphoribosylanthranilate isomerase
VGSSGRRAVHVKICGVTNLDDARGCVDGGASAIGVNLVGASPRCVKPEEARAIARHVGDRALVVLVVADLASGAIAELVRFVGCGCVQLHGSEPPETLLPLLPHAYKAVRIASEDDVEKARAYPGEYLLVDAKVPGVLGGSGTTFDWSLVRPLAKEKKLILAGGLTVENVANAVASVDPDSVDVASGVERDGDPRRKDLAKVRAFVERARGARP